MPEVEVRGIIAFRRHHDVSGGWAGYCVRGVNR